MSEPEIPDPEPVPLAPVAARERIAAMDVLRGIAVFGIFLINMPLYVAPPSGFFDWENNAMWAGNADRLATLFIYIFAQGKFYTLFSFLFGLGFGVQMLRAADRNAADFLPTYRRRLAILVAIGFLHFFLIWWGDVLHIYALLGFPLLAFRDRSDKTLLVWALCLTSIPLVGALGFTTFRHFTDTDTPAQQEKKRAEKHAENEKKRKEDIAVYSSGSAFEILRFRFRGNMQRIGGEVGWGIELFTNFLLGLWVSRRRILQEPWNYRPLLNTLAFLALPIGLAITVADLYYGYTHPGVDSPLWRTHLGFAREFLCRPAVAYGYAAALLLIGVRPWMMGFAAVGRMALTNYLLHSLVFTTVANAYGLGLYGQVHPLRGLLWCIAFYAMQMPFSILWLRRFQYGPAEWLWRTLTYGKKQRWLREPEPAAA